MVFDSRLWQSFDHMRPSGATRLYLANWADVVLQTSAAVSYVGASNQFIHFVAGYSVSVGKRNDSVLYFAGAPRSEHKGQVVLFKYAHPNWKVADRISGDQVGHPVAMADSSALPQSPVSGRGADVVANTHVFLC